MLYLVSLLPVVLFLILLILMDSFSIVRKGQLAIAICWGMSVCIALFQLFKYISLPDSEIVTPIVEELFKSLLLLYFIYKSKMAFFIDSAIYGAAVGVGFSLVENMIYISSFPDMLVGTAIFRGFGTAFMHAGVTAITGGIMNLVSISFRFAPKSSGVGRLSKPLINLLIVAAMLPAVIIHLLYNLYLLDKLPSLVTMAIPLLGLSTLLILLFQWDVNRIRSWIDNGINANVELLAQIKRGELAHTVAGEYILSIKENFKAEKVFDMCCYLIVSLELSIAIRRNMMLKEVGLKLPVKEDNSDKVKEYYALRANIGKTGEIALLPVLSNLHLNKWMIDSLK